MKHSNNDITQHMERLRDDFEKEYGSTFSDAVYVRTKDNIIFTSKALEEFYGTSHYNISKYVKKGLSNGDFTKESVCDNIYDIIENNDFCAYDAQKSKSRGRPPKGYDFDIHHYIGMNITTPQGERYRNWVKERIKEVTVDGYSINRERMVNDYSAFKKMDSEIKELRSNSTISSKQITDIFTKASDYNPKKKETRKCISLYHDLMNHAITHKTSAEIKYHRADSEKPNMGLTSFAGRKPCKGDVQNARNYYHRHELRDFIDLNTMMYHFTAYFSRKNEYTMAELVKYLKEILRLCKQDILNGYGSITPAEARSHVNHEYTLFKERDDDQTKLC